MAIITYTEGIKIECRNKDIKANLLNNRSAANYFLKNYNLSLKDSELALLLKPTYEKALERAALCCFEIGKYVDAIKYCDIILNEKSDKKPILMLMQKSVMRHRSLEMRQKLENKKNIHKLILLQTIKSRGIKFFCFKDDYEFEDLQPVEDELADERVYINDELKLVWPVIFFLPEYMAIQYVTKFCEDEM